MTILSDPEYQIQAQSLNEDGSLGEYYTRYVEPGKSIFSVVVANNRTRECTILALQENAKVNPEKLVFVYEENGKLRVTSGELVCAEVQVFKGDDFIDALEMNYKTGEAAPSSDAEIELFDRTGGHSFRPVAGFAHPLLHALDLELYEDLGMLHKNTCPSGKISREKFTITPLSQVGMSDEEILAEQIGRRTR